VRSRRKCEKVFLRKRRLLFSIATILIMVWRQEQNRNSELAEHWQYLDFQSPGGRLFIIPDSNLPSSAYKHQRAQKITVE